MKTMPKKTFLLTIALASLLFVFSGCTSRGYIESVPDSAEAEVYRQIIREYAVGDWLYEYERTGNWHVARIFDHLRLGSLNLSPADMEHAKRLIQAYIVYNTTSIREDCWEISAEYGKTYRAPASGPYPACLAHWGFPVSSNHKSPRNYMDKAGISIPVICC